MNFFLNPCTSHRGPNRLLGRMLAILILAVWAGAAQADWNVAELMKTLAERPSGQVRYSEVKYSALLKEPLRLSGKLRYRKPAFLEKHVQTPFEEILTVEGERLMWEKPATQKKHVLALHDYPAIWGFIESMRATLNGDASTLERFYRIRLEGREQQWTLVLLPSDSDMAQFIRVIRISGSKARISSVEIVESSGDRSLMTLREDTP